MTNEGRLKWEMIREVSEHDEMLLLKCCESWGSNSRKCQWKDGGPESGEVETCVLRSIREENKHDICQELKIKCQPVFSEHGRSVGQHSKNPISAQILD